MSFVGDNKNRQRSGQSVGGNWAYQNRTAGAGQHTTAEGIAALHAINAWRSRLSIAAVGFKLVSDGGDYYNCYLCDGVSTGTTTIKVAKTPNNRCGTGAITAKTIRGTAYTYAYSAVTVSSVVVEYARTVTKVSDSSTTTSLITPCINVGDLMYAIPAFFAGPSSLLGVRWLIINSPEFSDPV